MAVRRIESIPMLNHNCINLNNQRVIWKPENLIPSWSNSDIDIVKTVKCIIPFELLTLMISIENQAAHSDEFALYLKGNYKDEVLTVFQEYILPKQKVTGASVDFEEDSPVGFNGVIHRHPGNLTTFSGTDAMHINKNYMFSLLYVNHQIPTGIINIQLQGSTKRVQLALDLVMQYPEVKHNLDLSNIQRSIPTYAVGGRSNFKSMFLNENPTFDDEDTSTEEDRKEFQRMFGQFSNGE